MFAASMFQPVSQLAVNYGVKAVVHGGPGVGKTPFLLTAPDACFAFSEPGLRSVRHCNNPGVIIDSYAKTLDFISWCVGSQEARQYQVKCLDSVSQIAEQILKEAKASPKKDPRQYYGELAEKMMGLMDMIFYARGVHFIMIAKRGLAPFEGIDKYRPYFPGQELNIRIPHLFDSVWSLEYAMIGGTSQRAIRTRENGTVFARERSGNLAELEAPDLRALITKSMQ